MAETHEKRDDSEFAEELAARLDAGLLEPTDDDSPETKALLSTFARLQKAVGEPDPRFFTRLRSAILHGARSRGTERQHSDRWIPLPRLLPHFGLRKTWAATAFHMAVILAVAAGFVAFWWYNGLPQRVDAQQTIVVGPTRLIPGSDASVRVVVQDTSKDQPVSGAHVEVSLKPAKGAAKLLYKGRTDDTGSLPVRFHVPANAAGDSRLVVEARSTVGKDRVEQQVTVQRDYRLLLTSDKPLYQPGQVIHMRALALSTFDLTPARGATVDFLVQDAKGNKVFRKSVQASEWGIAAADFTLADMVNQGNYKLSVSIGDDMGQAEKTVEVRPYVLPKFGVGVSTERSFYLLGQTVRGVVQADYFFGKPVTGGQVRIVGCVWDVERTEVLELQGQTDENGTYEFSFDLPAYLAGRGLDLAQTEFLLEVTVTDQTDHAEQTSQTLPVAAQPLIIEAVAEGGTLKPGVENVVYILTSYPDGQPAQTQLEISVDGQALVALATGEYGLAEFVFTPLMRPYDLHIVARDQAGLSASRDVNLDVERAADNILLRADRAAYVVGETMHLTALTPVQSGSVYLDIVKAGQTLSTRSQRVEGGKAEFLVDVSPDLYGTLELHAYKIQRDGTAVRDTRVVVVDTPNELDVRIATSRETHLPGETATIDLQTTDREGAGARAALGIAVVDESVFALQRQDPGFAKLYFLLEQELMEPFYQVKGFELPASVSPDAERIREAQDRTAKASWAQVPVTTPAETASSRSNKMRAAFQVHLIGINRVGQWTVVGLGALPLISVIVALVELWRARGGKRVTVRLDLVIGFMILVGFLVTKGLPVLEDYLHYTGERIPIGLTTALGLVIVLFAGYAWATRDPAAKLLVLLTLGWAAFLGLLLLVWRRYLLGSQLPIVIPLGYLGIPIAYFVFGLGRWMQGRYAGEPVRCWGGVAATLLGVLCILYALPVLSLPDILLRPYYLDMLRAQGSALEAESLSRRYGLDRPAFGLGNWGLFSPPPDELREADGRGQADIVEVPSAGSQPVAPRLRQYFPETLYWAPEVTTDKKGFVSLQVPMADSITTWRLTALASSQDGRLGFATHGIRVFQDFFVDIDLPVALTQGDEISIPVGVFNYLAEPQEVRLVVEQEPWFELLGEAEQTLTIASNDIEVVYFPIRVKAFGQQGFQVTAWGSRLSDAIRREVKVVPLGKEMRATESDRLREGREVVVDIPAAAVPDTGRVEVKIYPGVMAQVIEGLEKILRLPHG